MNIRKDDIAATDIETEPQLDLIEEFYKFEPKVAEEILKTK